MLKGFTKSPTEHIMNEYPDGLSVRTLKGRILLAGSKTGLAATIIEVRMANPQARVCETTSGKAGFFRIQRLPEGEYFSK